MKEFIKISDIEDNPEFFLIGQIQGTLQWTCTDDAEKLREIEALIAEFEADRKRRFEAGVSDTACTLCGLDNCICCATCDRPTRLTAIFKNTDTMCRCEEEIHERN
ncbi:MAG: hypothetical protein PHC88_05445 [Terrimicrobiaceae bacterium]|nr:hypothetical protein [Terrimicrobiaceae bacterium]